jgi:hypothetical protein
MIDHVFTFLKDQLNSYLKVKTGVEGFEVVFVQERTPREITLPKEALSAVLVNIEEERTFRSGAAYQHQRDITALPTKTLLPHLLYLNLYVLFIANFTNYSQCLKLLSLVISFFHSHRLFESQNSPALSSEVKKLTLELVNLPFEEEKDIWSLLGNPYVPSVLYKVRMIVFEDIDSLDVGADITNIDVFPASM